MKKCCLIWVVIIGFLFLNNAYADVFTGEWRLFVNSAGTEISEDKPSIGVTISKSGTFYNVQVKLPAIQQTPKEGNFKERGGWGGFLQAQQDQQVLFNLAMVRDRYTGKYVLSDDEKSIDNINGSVSFKYRKNGDMICSNDFGCFNHGKTNLGDSPDGEQISGDAGSLDGTVRKISLGDIGKGVKSLFAKSDDQGTLDSSLQNHPAALNYREIKNEETESHIYKSFVVFTGAPYDAAWSALITDLGKTACALGKTECYEIRTQDKNSGTIEFVQPMDKAHTLSVDLKITLMKSESNTGQAQIQMSIQCSAARRFVINKADIIKEFARLMNIVRDTKGGADEAANESPSYAQVDSASNKGETSEALHADLSSKYQSSRTFKNGLSLEEVVDSLDVYEQSEEKKGRVRLLEMNGEKGRISWIQIIGNSKKTVTTKVRVESLGLGIKVTVTLLSSQGLKIKKASATREMNSVFAEVDKIGKR